jgi:hypothetical protein
VFFFFFENLAEELDARACRSRAHWCRPGTWSGRSRSSRGAGRSLGPPPRSHSRPSRPNSRKARPPEGPSSPRVRVAAFPFPSRPEGKERSPRVLIAFSGSPGPGCPSRLWPSPPLQTAARRPRLPHRAGRRPILMNTSPSRSRYALTAPAPLPPSSNPRIFHLMRATLNPSNNLFPRPKTFHTVL